MLETRRLAVPEPRLHEDVLDEVDLKYSRARPWSRILGWVEHATMGAEALVELGLGSEVAAWVLRHPAQPFQSHPLAGLSWPEDLGKRERYADWLRYFGDELEKTSFTDVLAIWVPRLTHDVGCALFHGLIQTAHAVRALEHENTGARRWELARGLAVWASRVTPRGIHVHRLPAELMLDMPTRILDFARVGADAFLQRRTFPNLHLVTGPMAYLMISRYLDGATQRLAESSFRRTHATALGKYGFSKPVEIRPKAPRFPSEPELRSLAQWKNAHPIKLVEASLRAHRMSQDDIFIEVAQAALHWLPRWM